MATQPLSLPAAPELAPKLAMADKKRIPVPAPSVCPVCGEDVPHNALACPECGADHNSGWREDAERYDGVQLPEHDFDYNDFVKQEFGSQAKPPGLKTIWWIVGIVLIVAVILYFASVR
jgi:hypothetical protein